MPREYRVEPGGTSLEGLFRSVIRADGTAGLLVWLRDVSSRKRAEAHAAALQEELEHAQKLEALGRLAGGVAHDFNNLLTTVGGYADLIARHPDSKIRDVSRELASIRERGKALTQQLLAFARRERAEPQVIDLGDTLGGMERLLRQLVGERISLATTIETGARILIDPARLQQLILNLVVNARDAMRRGGTLRLVCRVRPQRQRVELEVGDTGMGIDTETRSRIFEPFFTTKARGQGTGLGLSTVHGIVESSDGNIDVDSQPGKGTTFTVSWRLQADTSHRSRPELAHPESARGRARVLVAEDDPEGRRVLVNLLEQAGYTVMAAQNGIEALDNLERDYEGIDLLLSDVRMPAMGGPELARELRRRFPGLPVLFISGYCEPDLEGVDLEGQQLLFKPYTSTELLKRIDRCLTVWAPTARRA
jgi:signal transduction histidine kinase